MTENFSAFSSGRSALEQGFDLEYWKEQKQIYQTPPDNYYCYFQKHCYLLIFLQDILTRTSSSEDRVLQRMLWYTHLYNPDGTIKLDETIISFFFSRQHLFLNVALMLSPSRLPKNIWDIHELELFTEHIKTSMFPVAKTADPNRVHQKQLWFHDRNREHFDLWCFSVQFNNQFTWHPVPSHLLTVPSFESVWGPGFCGGPELPEHFQREQLLKSIPRKQQLMFLGRSSISLTTLSRHQSPQTAGPGHQHHGNVCFTVETHSGCTVPAGYFDIWY